MRWALSQSLPSPPHRCRPPPMPPQRNVSVAAEASSNNISFPYRLSFQSFPVLVQWVLYCAKCHGSPSSPVYESDLSWEFFDVWVREFFAVRGREFFCVGVFGVLSCVSFEDSFPRSVLSHREFLYIYRAFIPRSPFLYKSFPLMKPFQIVDSLVIYVLSYTVHMQSSPVPHTWSLHTVVSSSVKYFHHRSPFLYEFFIIWRVLSCKDPLLK